MVGMPAMHVTDKSSLVRTTRERRMFDGATTCMRARLLKVTESIVYQKIEIQYSSSALANIPATRQPATIR
jgi:hypothetical protein